MFFGSHGLYPPLKLFNFRNISGVKRGAVCTDSTNFIDGVRHRRVMGGGDFADRIPAPFRDNHNAVIVFEMLQLFNLFNQVIRITGGSASARINEPIPPVGVCSVSQNLFHVVNSGHRVFVECSHGVNLPWFLMAVVAETGARICGERIAARVSRLSASAATHKRISRFGFCWRVGGAFNVGCSRSFFPINKSTGKNSVSAFFTGSVKFSRDCHFPYLLFYFGFVSLLALIYILSLGLSSIIFNYFKKILHNEINHIGDTMKINEKIIMGHRMLQKPHESRQKRKTRLMP
jgi:hypothetical protein